jgi:flagellar hook assembly protein FlgD
VLARGVDGVNLDFEPLPAGQSANFDALVQALRDALNAARPGLELVVDVTGDIGNYDVAALTAPGAADALFIMGYDYRGSGAAQAGSIAPLVSPTRYTDLTRTLQAYLALTTPDHLLLGLPYYGRAWSTASNQPNASTLPQNDQNGYSVAATYTAAADLAATNGLQWDGTETSAWTTYQRQFCATCPTVWRELYFDNAQSLAAKYQLVLADGLRGTGMWALGYDGTKPELTQLLHQVFGAVAPLPPSGSLAVTANNAAGNPPNAFSPNGDGVADSATLSWWISAPASGTIAIRAGSTTVWSAAVTDSSGSVTWNGASSSGTAVPDGTYAVVLTAQEADGTALTLTASVVVNRVVGFLAASPNRFFPQDGDARRRSAAISYRMATAGNSTLRILNGAGAVVRTAWYARRTPAGTYTWTWDGRDGTGAMVPQGDYTIQVVATGPVGRAFLTKPLTAAAYMVRTRLTGAAAALSYLVDAWSSERLRGIPSITLAIGGQTLAGTVVDLGGGHYQTTFSGLALAGSGTLTIAGVDMVGDADRYSIHVSFGDAARTAAGTLPPARSPAPSAAPAAGSSPAPSSAPTPSSRPASDPTTITAMCPSIWVRRGPSTAARGVTMVGAGATAVASGTLPGSAYTSSCYHVGIDRWWYEITALNGQPLANPLFVATAFWKKP